ncbi:RHS repeat domain-containing protein [Catelliglobosispora koreensis]|uniref:RHS repeat domain-containing protein n=1 Tax=Catelliglobosispora koreensis TaxID=129052 RepID=UPI00039D9C6E|nr:RHS repeat-associated core domain-containing protein [Catelliglobosispora koreensis]
MLRRWVAALPLALTATLLIGSPGVAAPQQLQAQQPESVKSFPVTGQGRPKDLSQGASESGAILRKLIRWPGAGSAEVRLDAQSRQAGQLPVSFGAAKQPGKVRVEVLDRATLPGGWRNGVVFRVTGSTDAEVSVDYSGFETAFGGDWAGRLKLYQLPECALSTPEAADCQAKPVKSSNNRAAKKVTSAAGALQAKPAAGVELQSAAPSGMLMAMTAGTSSETGDYAATKLQASSTWTAGGSSGDFSWNYPLGMPPSLGGPSPTIALGYSSSAVDGRTKATNNQPSWIGQGFEYDPGHIARQYTPCADDMGTSGANNTTKTGDLCFGMDNASFSLNGRGGELVKDDVSGKWRLKSDDGSRIERLDDTSVPGDNTVNGAWSNEYWKVTTPDGTQYFFGLNRLTGWASGNAVTNSVLTVPVAGNNPGERCKQTLFKDSFCAQAHRWNLDYVIDPHGNTMSYWYTKSTNKYAKNQSTTEATSYDREGVLTRIDYGTDNRSGVDTVYTATKAPMQVDFSTSNRCLTTSCGTKDEVNWPDTPWDQECTGTTCLGLASPSFFSTVRLTGVTTKVWGGSAYRPVDSWAFTHQFPPTGSGTPKGLWLESIVRTGHIGTPIAMPEVNFDWVALENRVDTYNGTKPTMNWHRMSTIWTETGGKISVRYTDKQCAPGNLPSAAHTNTMRCYPVLFEEDDVMKTEYFHKYLVTELYEADLTGGGTDKVTKYEYPGTPAWRFADDNGITKDKFRTWADYRGYDRVLMKTGAPGQETLTETKYFRGMHGSKDTPSGGSRAVNVAASIGASVPDEDAYSGKAREQTTFNGSETAPVTRTVNVPWQSAATASQDLGDTTNHARFTADDAIVYSSVFLDGGRGWLTTKKSSTFDAMGLVDFGTDHGKVSADGLTEVSGDETCSDNTYVHNTTKNIIGLISRTQSFALACTVNGAPTPSTKDDVIGDERTAFDGLGFGATPLKGLITQTDELKSWASGTGTSWLTTGVVTYDVYGRQKQLTDVRGNITTTTYTPELGGPLTKVDTATALGTATEEREPAWGVPTASIDINGKRTDMEYDALGRLANVWLPNRLKSGNPTSPSIKHTYLIRNTGGVNAVTSSRLNAAGNYVHSYALYDGLLRTRQTQAAAQAGGGTVFTEIKYDAAGRESVSNAFFYDATVAPGTGLRTILDWQHKAQTVTEYDRASRVVAKVVKASGAEKFRTSTSYGGDRNYVTPPAGATPLTTLTDARGRKTELRQHYGGSLSGSFDATTYEYDRKGQLIKILDAANNEWRTEYGMQGQVLANVDPDKGRTEYKYNDYGDQTEVLDARGEKLVVEYDTLGRKLAVYDDAISPAKKRSSWAYDPTGFKGQLASASRWTGTNREHEYKLRFRGYTPLYASTGEDYIIPAVETGLSGTYTFTRTYKVDGSPATVGYPNAGGLGGETVTYTYDSTTGLPEQVQTNWPGAGQYITNIDHTAFGEVGFMQYQQTAGSWLQRSLVHDETTRRVVQDTTIRQTAPQSISDVHYTFDAVGAVKKIADTASNDTQCFTSDDLGRLQWAWTPSNGDCGPAPATAALGGPAPYRYKWDVNKVGNRTKQTGEGTESTYTYPAATQARPHAATSVTTTGSGAGTKNYAFDVAGFMTCRPAAGALSNTCGGANSQDLVWDAEGRLESAANATNTYLYTADGARLIARDPSGTTLYLSNMELRRPSSGAVTATRFYAQGGATFAQRTSGGVAWLAGDHQGTQSISVAAGNQAVTQRRQTPYGEDRGSAVTWPNSKGFVGGDKDPTGLTHIGAREYDPVLGKFTSVDPLFNSDEPQTMNNYAYANNNPVTRSDPSGACIPDDDNPGRCIPGTHGRSTPPAPLPEQKCTPSTRNYCHPPGGNKTTTRELVFAWITGAMLGCRGKGLSSGPNDSCYLTEYFRDGDDFTKKIQALPHLAYARAVIAEQLRNGGKAAYGHEPGEVHNHNKDKNAVEKIDTLIGDMLGIASWGGVGHEDPAFFLGSFDLNWEVVGHSANGDPVVEFHLLNATTQESGSLKPSKLWKYSAGGLAGDGNDAKPGERWLQQSVRWRETIDMTVRPLPTPMPGPPSSTAPTILGTPNPTPGPAVR